MQSIEDNLTQQWLGLGASMNPTGGATLNLR